MRSKICDGIIFDFWSGLPHMLFFLSTQDCYMFFFLLHATLQWYMLYITSETTVADTQLFCNRNLIGMPLKWPRVELEFGHRMYIFPILGRLECSERGVGASYINQTIRHAVSTYLWCAFCPSCDVFVSIESVFVPVFCLVFMVTRNRDVVSNQLIDCCHDPTYQSMVLGIQADLCVHKRLLLGLRQTCSHSP